MGSGLKWDCLILKFFHNEHKDKAKGQRVEMESYQEHYTNL